MSVLLWGALVVWLSLCLYVAGFMALSTWGIGWCSWLVGHAM